MFRILTRSGLAPTGAANVALRKGSVAIIYALRDLVHSSPSDQKPYCRGWLRSADNITYKNQGQDMPFFDRITPYFDHLRSRRFSDAILGALDILGAFHDAVPAAYPIEHKGTPFYIMGVAAFASRDYSTASLYFDAAVSEDIRTHGLNADKPALRFLRLTDPDTEPKFLGHDIIELLTGIVQELVGDYNARPGAQAISLDAIRTHFLGPIISSPDVHKRSLVTTFISFVAEWKYRARQIELIDVGSREPFFTHMFRGCLLFESLLKEKHPQQPAPAKTTLGNYLQANYTKLGIPNNLAIGGVLFEDVITSLTTNMSIEGAIQTAGQFRNTLGHDIAWPTAALTQTSYDIAVTNIASASLHAISVLYR